jgi:cell division septal protein FtsQ
MIPLRCVRYEKALLPLPSKLFINSRKKPSDLSHIYFLCQIFFITFFSEQDLVAKKNIIIVLVRMFNRKSSRRRKHFLIDTNQQKKCHPKKNRNRILNLFTKILFIKRILKLFRVSFIFTFLSFIMITFIAFTVFSPYFKIKKININRDNANLDILEVQGSLESFYGTSLVFLDKNNLEQTLLDEFLEFKSIEITEEWPDELTLTIKLAQPVFTLFDTESANFAVISTDGVILSLSPDNKLPVLKIKKQKKPFKLGEKIINTAWIEKINNTKSALLNQIKLTTKEIILFPVSQEVHFVTDSNITLWFDLRIDITPQIRKLELGANQIGLYSKTIKHIDLRIPGQLFWK